MDTAFTEKIAALYWWAQDSKVHIAAPSSGSCRGSAFVLAVHLPNLHLVLCMRLNKGVNLGIQSALNIHVRNPVRKCALNREYALIKQIRLTTSQYGTAILWLLEVTYLSHDCPSPVGCVWTWSMVLAVTEGRSVGARCEQD